MLGKAMIQNHYFMVTTNKYGKNVFILFVATRETIKNDETSFVRALKASRAQQLLIRFNQLNIVSKFYLNSLTIYGHLYFKFIRMIFLVSFLFHCTTLTLIRMDRKQILGSSLTLLRR